MEDEEDYEYYEEEGSAGEGDKSTAANESYPLNHSVGSHYKGNTSAAGGGGGKASSLADRFRKGANPTPAMGY